MRMIDAELTPLHSRIADLTEVGVNVDAHASQPTAGWDVEEVEEESEELAVQRMIEEIFRIRELNDRISSTNHTETSDEKKKHNSE